MYKTDITTSYLLLTLYYLTTLFRTIKNNPSNLYSHKWLKSLRGAIRLPFINALMTDQQAVGPFRFPLADGPSISARLFRNIGPFGESPCEFHDEFDCDDITLAALASSSWPLLLFTLLAFVSFHGSNCGLMVISVVWSAYTISY